MVRELVIQGWCDVCLEDTGNHVASVRTFSLRLDAVEREVDLCPEHTPALEEVATFLQTYGNPVDQTPRSTSQADGQSRSGPKRVSGANGELVDKEDPAARTCPLCAQVSATRPGMRDHLKRMHHTTLSRLGITTPRGRYGQALKAEREAREVRQPALATG